MTADEKSAVESALAELKSALEDTDADTQAIRSKMDALITASQAMATRLYQQAAAEQAGGESGGEGSDEDIVEAEIIDEGENE